MEKIEQLQQLIKELKETEHLQIPNEYGETPYSAALNEWASLRYRWTEQGLLRDSYIIMDYKEKLNELDNKKSHIFVTINPPPQYYDNLDNLKDFLQRLEKMVKGKKWIEEFFYVIEQRGEVESEIGKGFHAHIILNYPKLKPSLIRSQLGYYFTSIMDIKHNSIFNIQFIDYEQMLRKKNSYLLGQKKDVSKHLKQKMDILFRQRYRLESAYSQGSTC